MLQQNMAIG